eukprot:CAMPEP_0175065702 /NCGR_PEP_ID=MMETSP0052_2-20121109/16084_1 /TAXON_ID=51329 ORGANISM="Polytomella parva, Strain SAG 63-3" /NCGR_SAMPLE_ID=MMETSP0052_2 /ASSEMBLY_ACC=CAM_ASM_000194 /LENGTH=83 /DNA_ID=CAMNT_0016332291 /DNA_START=23 /DNA_END=271 /DNA_ORIENTATION=-
MTSTQNNIGARTSSVHTINSPGNPSAHNLNTPPNPSARNSSLRKGAGGSRGGGVGSGSAIAPSSPGPESANSYGISHPSPSLT